MAQIIADSLRQAWINFLDSVRSVLPNVVAMLSIIVLGWLIAMVFGFVIRRVLGWLKFDALSRRLGAGDVLKMLDQASGPAGGGQRPAALGTPAERGGAVPHHHSHPGDGARADRGGDDGGPHRVRDRLRRRDAGVRDRLRQRRRAGRAEWSLPRRRGFGGKARPIERAALEAVAWLPGAGEPRALALIGVHYAD